jgi:Rrf2 family protein
MQITRQADYAVRAVLYLARLGTNERASTSTVAEEQRIPPSFLAKIISQLSIAGLLHTSRGARGGVTLARDAKDISLLEVIEAIDGPIQLNECVGEDGECTFDEDCVLRPVWSEAQQELVKRLKGTNFAHLLEKSKVPA